MKNKFKVSLLLLSIYALPVAYASEGSGSHGGDGLIINGKPYLLDLVEAGVEEAPIYDGSVPAQPDIKRFLKKSLPLMQDTVEKLAQKISEIHAINPRIAWAITYSFGLYDFRLVSPTLLNIQDENSALDYDPKLLVQLAVRKDAVVMIDRVNWKKLDNDNKSALLLHEMIYSLGKKVNFDFLVGYDHTGKPIYSNSKKQLSASARAIVGFLYSGSLTSQNDSQKWNSLLKGNKLYSLIAKKDFVNSVYYYKSGFLLGTETLTWKQRADEDFCETSFYRENVSSYKNGFYLNYSNGETTINDVKYPAISESDYNENECFQEYIGFQNNTPNRIELYQ